MNPTSYYNLILVGFFLLLSLYVLFGIQKSKFNTPGLIVFFITFTWLHIRFFGFTYLYNFITALFLVLAVLAILHLDTIRIRYLCIFLMILVGILLTFGFGTLAEQLGQLLFYLFVLLIGKGLLYE